MDKNNFFSISQINENLFLSGIDVLEMNSSLVKKLGITHILSCLSGKYISDIHKKIILENPQMIIKYLPLNDEFQQNLWKKCSHLNISDSDYNKPLIEIAYHFIDSAIMNGGKVLIHCMVGVSRSATLVIYYIMKKYSLKYSTAYAIVKGKRSVIEPNKSFENQLLIYEKKGNLLTEKDVETIINNI